MTRRPLSGFLDPLRSLADECRPRGTAFTDDVLGRRGKVLAPLVSVLHGLPGQEAYPEPAELPRDEGRERFVLDLTETLLAMARRRVLLVLLDDLQWADDLTIQVLAHLAARLGSDPARLVVLATYRGDEPVDAVERLGGAAGVTRRTVGRIGPEGVAEGGPGGPARGDGGLARPPSPRGPRGARRTGSPARGLRPRGPPVGREPPRYIVRR